MVLATVDPNPLSGGLDAVIRALLEGRPAIVPTDTLYGLAVSPLHAPSPQVLYEIKGRPSDKPVAWLVGAREDLEGYGVDVPGYASALADVFWPGALTLIVKARANVPLAYQSAEGTIGLRMPDDALVRSIAERVGCPLAVTSANVSGGADPRRFVDIDSLILSQVSAAVDDDQAKSGIGSTVVDCTFQTPVILREGAITRAQIETVANRQATVRTSRR